MTLYNTIPTNTEDETLLKQSKTSLKGIVAGAAVTSFILGIVVATAMSPTYTPKQTSLTSTSCDTTSQATCLTIYGCQWFNDNGDVSGDVGTTPRPIPFSFSLSSFPEITNKHLIPKLLIQRCAPRPVLAHGRRPVDVAALERARRGRRRGPARRAHHAALLLLAAF